MLPCAPTATPYGRASASLPAWPMDRLNVGAGAGCDGTTEKLTGPASTW
jgi:hypothetical protein